MGFGHKIREWRFKHLHNPDEQELSSLPDHDLQSGLSYIKTHACYSGGYDRGMVIYAIRNGMDALSSHAHYRLDFGINAGEEVAVEHAEELQRIIVNGLPMCGYWSDNVCSWINAARDKSNILILRFEDVIAKPRHYLRAIQSFTGASIIDYEPVLFEDSKALNARFFRKGSTNRELFSDPSMASLFYAFEGAGMIACGYVQQMPWFCVTHHGDFINIDSDCLRPEEVQALQFILGALERHHSFIHPRQIGGRGVRLGQIKAMSQQRLLHLSAARDRKIMQEFIRQIDLI